MKHIAILHGPNFETLGAREPEHYGTRTLADLKAYLGAQALSLGGLTLSFFESNHEGALIDHLYALQKSGCAGIIFNPGALAHTSLALHDALVALNIPALEVHLSQVIKRAQVDPARQPLVIAPACRGVIMGLGFQGYALALRALFEISLTEDGAP